MAYYYSYSIVTDSDTFMPVNYTGKLVIKIQNISMGCTAKFNTLNL
jgi:hypothetical protein